MPDCGAAGLGEISQLLVEILIAPALGLAQPAAPAGGGDSAWYIVLGRKVNEPVETSGAEASQPGYFVVGFLERAGYRGLVQNAEGGEIFYEIPILKQLPRRQPGAIRNGERS